MDYEDYTCSSPIRENNDQLQDDPHHYQPPAKIDDPYRFLQTDENKDPQDVNVKGQQNDHNDNSQNTITEGSSTGGLGSSSSNSNPNANSLAHSPFSRTNSSDSSQREGATGRAVQFGPNHHPLENQYNNEIQNINPFMNGTHQNEIETPQANDQDEELKEGRDESQETIECQSEQQNKVVVPTDLSQNVQPYDEIGSMHSEKEYQSQPADHMTHANDQNEDFVIGAHEEDDQERLQVDQLENSFLGNQPKPFTHRDYIDLGKNNINMTYNNNQYTRPEQNAPKLEKLQEDNVQIQQQVQECKQMKNQSLNPSIDEFGNQLWQQCHTHLDDQEDQIQADNDLPDPVKQHMQQHYLEGGCDLQGKNPEQQIDNASQYLIQNSSSEACTHSESAPFYQGDHPQNDDNNHSQLQGDTNSQPDQLSQAESPNNAGADYPIAALIAAPDGVNHPPVQDTPNNAQELPTPSRAFFDDGQSFELNVNRSFEDLNHIFDRIYPQNQKHYQLVIDVYERADGKQKGLSNQFYNPHREQSANNNGRQYSNHFVHGIFPQSQQHNSPPYSFSHGQYTGGGFKKYGGGGGDDDDDDDQQDRQYNNFPQAGDIQDSYKFQANLQLLYKLYPQEVIRILLAQHAINSPNATRPVYQNCRPPYHTHTPVAPPWDEGNTAALQQDLLRQLCNVILSTQGQPIVQTPRIYQTPYQYSDYNQCLKPEIALHVAYDAAANSNNNYCFVQSSFVNEKNTQKPQSESVKVTFQYSLMVSDSNPTQRKLYCAFLKVKLVDLNQGEHRKKERYHEQKGAANSDQAPNGVLLNANAKDSTDQTPTTERPANAALGHSAQQQALVAATNKFGIKIEAIKYDNSELPDKNPNMKLVRALISLQDFLQDGFSEDELQGEVKPELFDLLKATKLDLNLRVEILGITRSKLKNYITYYNYLKDNSKEFQSDWEKVTTGDVVKKKNRGGQKQVSNKKKTAAAAMMPALDGDYYDDDNDGDGDDDNKNNNNNNNNDENDVAALKKCDEKSNNCIEKDQNSDSHGEKSAARKKLNNQTRGAKAGKKDSEKLFQKMQALSHLIPNPAQG